MTFRFTATALLQFIAILLYSLSVTGCITAKVLNEDQLGGYEDHFHQVYTAADGTTLLVLGEKYDYLLTLSKDLKQGLDAAKGHDVRIYVNSFDLFPDNSLKGSVELSIFPRNNDDFDWAKTQGYKKTGKILARKFNVSATRVTRNSTLKAPATELKSQYSIRIKNKPSRLIHAAKLAVSPITLAADGTLLVLGSPFFLAEFIILANTDWSH